ncbi:hypothetical protein EAE99_003336 [Botrytis elliptica]|nr:hypothetical protein EAE99_003336 [Botrytis elliptica]
MILISHDVSESDHVTTTDPEPNQGPYDDIPQCISKTMTKFSNNKAIPAAKNGHPHRRLEHGYRRSVRVRHSTPIETGHRTIYPFPARKMHERE